MLNSLLPLSDDTDLHKSVLAECIGDTGYPLPLDRVSLNSKYVTGDVTDGIADEISIGGVHMLLGNDLAGGQVNMCPVLCEKPVMSVDKSELQPECDATRVMSQKPERESENDVSGIQGDSDGDMTLSERLYSNWCEPVSLENPTTVPCGCQN